MPAFLRWLDNLRASRAYAAGAAGAAVAILVLMLYYVCNPPVSKHAGLVRFSLTGPDVTRLAEWLDYQSRQLAKPQPLRHLAPGRATSHLEIAAADQAMLWKDIQIDRRRRQGGQGWQLDLRYFGVDAVGPRLAFWLANDLRRRFEQLQGEATATVDRETKRWSAANQRLREANRTIKMANSQTLAAELRLAELRRRLLTLRELESFLDTEQPGEPLPGAAGEVSSRQGTVADHSRPQQLEQTLRAAAGELRALRQLREQQAKELKPQHPLMQELDQRMQRTSARVDALLIRYKAAQSGVGLADDLAQPPESTADSQRALLATEEKTLVAELEQAEDALLQVKNQLARAEARRTAAQARREAAASQLADARAKYLPLFCSTAEIADQRRALLVNSGMDGLPVVFALSAGGLIFSLVLGRMQDLGIRIRTAADISSQLSLPVLGTVRGDTQVPLLPAHQPFGVRVLRMCSEFAILAALGMVYLSGGVV